MPIIQVGNFKLVGRAATAVLLALLAGVVLWIVRHPPSLRSWPMLAAIALWIVFISYWNRAARNSAPDRTMESMRSRQIHQLFLNGAMLLVFVPIPGLRLRLLAAAPWQAPGGLGITLLGVAIAIWSRRHLGRYWSGRVSIKVDHELIRSGPYRVLRHPIYTGLLLMYLGTALISCELHGLVAVLLAIYAYWRKIGIEEAALAEAFGEKWSEHRRKTWALLPGIY